MYKRGRPLYAVLIDADNISAKHAEPIFKEIADYGELGLRRVYGDWSDETLQGWADTVNKYGLVAHQDTANTKGKNASDIGLVIDAMDILHAGRFDGFILVSSDSDFTALANRIREQGLEVIGIGEHKTPESLRNVCNRFIFLENLTDESTTTTANQRISTGKRPAEEAAPIIIAAMDKMEPDKGWYSLSVLGKHILAANSDFDSRTYGHKNLSSLVRNIEQFDVQEIGQTLSVRPNN